MPNELAAYVDSLMEEAARVMQKTLSRTTDSRRDTGPTALVPSDQR